MVTPETEAKFELRGVYLVSAEAGRRLFREELTRTSGTPVEIICGAGPWEYEETKRGVIQAAPEAPPLPNLGSLLGRAAVETRPTGEKIMTLKLEAGQHPFLADLNSAGATLPPSAALELMAEAARNVWPRWCVVEVRDLRGIANLDIAAGGSDIEIRLSPPPYGSSQGFDVSAALKIESDNGEAAAMVQCVVALERAYPAPDPAPRTSHDERALTVSKLYGDAVSRGKRLQVIESVQGLSPSGASATVLSSQPADWLTSGEPSDTWVFDPALVDAAAQIVAAWARTYRDSALSVLRYGRVVRYKDTLPARMQMDFVLAPATEAGIIRGNVTFFDEAGTPLLTIEDLDSALDTGAAGKAGTASKVMA